MSFTLAIALGWYLEKALAIFPCKEKRPLIETGFKAASKDPEQIKSWWSTWPHAQFGVPTGQINSLLVVDIDGPKGQIWLAKQNWDPTFTVETSPGHVQLWFRQPQGVVTKSTAGQIAEEVDIRGDGAYVIGPFSFHHETKHPYTPLSLDHNRIEAPAELLALTIVNHDEPPLSQPIDADAIPEGHRHRTIVSFAGSMRARGLSPGAILVNLRILNVQHCKPPLEDSDLQRIAKDIGKKPAGFRGSQPYESSAEVEIESFAALPIERITWLWTARIAAGKLNLFVGDPEKGKSLVSIDVAARVSTGRDFPDGTPCEPGDVLIVSCEDDAGDTVAPRLLEAGADLARPKQSVAIQSRAGHGQAPRGIGEISRHQADRHRSSRRLYGEH